MMTKLVTLVAAALLVAMPASAQLGGVGVPGLPQTPNIGEVTQRLPDPLHVQTPAPELARDLTKVRHAAIAALLTRHGDVLEADPAGQPIIRGEVLAIAPDDHALAAALARGFSIKRRDPIDGMGDLIVLSAPAGVATNAALQMLRSTDQSGEYDFDHLNLPSGEAHVAPARTQPPAMTARGPEVGLIDGGVGAHVSLRGAIAEQRSFGGDAVTPTAHATAVASLMVGRGNGVRGSAPDARLYVADIYGGDPTGGSSLGLVRGLSWLTSIAIPVINISLVGPRNRIVETVIASAVRRGFVIVAAVGNDGPAAPPLYPAAYPGVIGVTGVDARSRALVEAERGPQVTFAAAGIANAAAVGGEAVVRGTSFAAPIVAGLLADRMRAVSDRDSALSALRDQAQDLGAPGRDDTYGYGLVGGPARVSSSR